MGFTHYIKSPKGFTDSQWEEFCKGVAEIFKNSAVPLAGPLGEAGTDPIISENRISFNGLIPNEYETCQVLKEVNKFNFCKTQFRPYNNIVCMVYNLAKKCNPSIEISTDGDLDENGDIIELDMVALEATVKKHGFGL